MRHFHTKMSPLGLCTLFSKVTLFSLPEVFCGPQICKKCFGGRGDPAGRAQRRGLGGGHPSPIPTPSAPSVLGFCGSQCKILATPLGCRQNSSARVIVMSSILRIEYS